MASNLPLTVHDIPELFLNTAVWNKSATETDEGKQDLAAGIMIGHPIELTDQSNEVPEGTI